MPLVKVYDAATAFKCLNGIVNVFKPAGMMVGHVRGALLHNITKDLNSMKQGEPTVVENQRLMLESGGAQTPIMRKIARFCEHELAVGPAYQIDDIRCGSVGTLGEHTSGVLLFGINKGLKQSSRIQYNRPIRVYHITGCLGTATESHFHDSHITVRAKYRHVRPERITALAASMQASHQRKMFELCGVDLQSQTAYEIACKGLIRPANKSQPVIYGIKLIESQLPSFTLEVHAINETEDYLGTLIHEMGIELRTVAHCQAIRCIRHGHFKANDALLRHSWSLAGVLHNMRIQKNILTEHPYLIDQQNITLQA